MLRYSRPFIFLVITALCYLPAVGRASSVEMFGLLHTALGGSVIDAQADGLHVTNIGIGGIDGVFVALPADTTRLHADIGGVTAAGTHPNGAYLQAQGLVNIGGVPDQVVSTARVTDLGKQWGLTFDFSKVTAEPLTVQYILGGNVIHEESVDGLSLPGWFTNLLPTSFGPTGCIIPKYCGEFRIDFSAEWTFAKVESPQGEIYAIDQLRVVTAPLSNDFNGYTGVTYTGSGISEFTITDEHLTQAVPEPTTFVMYLLGLTLLGISVASPGIRGGLPFFRMRQQSL